MNRPANGRCWALGHALLFGSIVLGVVAHLLLKHGVSRAAAGPDFREPLLLIGLGLGVYAAGTACWMVCLSRLPLSYAYPYTGLNYVLILLGSSLLFHDIPSPNRLAGVALILAGTLLMPARRQVPS